jgi:hypothetical protein
LNELPANAQISNDWIIALTDGEDNGSARYGHTKQTVMNLLRNSDVNVVIIGVGHDVQTQVSKEFFMKMYLKVINIYLLK